MSGARAAHREFSRFSRWPLRAWLQIYVLKALGKWKDKTVYCMYKLGYFSFLSGVFLFFNFPTAGNYYRTWQLWLWGKKSTVQIHLTDLPHKSAQNRFCLGFPISDTLATSFIQICFCCCCFSFSFSLHIELYDDSADQPALYKIMAEPSRPIIYDRQTV